MILMIMKLPIPLTDGSDSNDRSDLYTYSDYFHFNHRERKNLPILLLSVQIRKKLLENILLPSNFFKLRILQRL